MTHDFIDALSMPLPEDILKRKWAGDLEDAVKAIDLRLESELPGMLRRRLITEKERIRRLPTQYPWNRAQAMAQLRALVPDVTEEEFDALELAGRIDFIYLGGEKRYFVRFHKTLVKFPDMMRRMGKVVDGKSPWLDPMIAAIREKGCLRRRITLETSVYVDEDAFVPGDYRAWLPIPARSAQQSDIRLLSGDPDEIAPEDAEARTAYWRRTLTAWDKFRLTYSYVTCIRYADPLHAPAPDAPLYPDAPPPTGADLQEEGAYIHFTPYLRALEKELAQGTEDPAEKAWRYYEFVTTKVKYSFMRDYFQIDHHGEYCAVNLKGDCGLQALLFISLCRIGGIPARWQSGLSIDDGYVGSHDWAQFYLPGWGWLFADPSFGGGAYRNGSASRHAFYFGNIDPMRMAANRRYQAEITPPMEHFRIDPFDNQSGEIERVGAEEGFTGRQVDGDAVLLSVEDLP
ncbi:MAG: transglutaminase domain-containing protein [Christensenellaceae bacterium]|nr:transglutaminase domain-containing protein [Christensenellaceae bacterium]